ncbi:hypothetical protein F3Y22_tig00110763pilonHSYRG00005 [Hibiscus syriacus]|uniref:Uncharacterized protein n=1 Tax=Hibiscus syriacus TaxID=106335 RepID=A0A6A2ZT29_HIBSY|nr:hypothetical protein F3Y22_tig00110763pilonHSYRG00005 [Hibiscus syriacus]
MMILQPVPSSAAVAVDKATSELLNTPDWTLNINICDSLNSNPRQRKDFLKAVKRRLQHRNYKVQLLALTLLETMVKNCGDFVHYQIDEREVLRDMIKMVKKKADTRVRDKILGLLESWQEEFGGRTGEHPQYYWACQDLKRSGVSFPESSPNAVPIIAPLAKRHPAYGTPSNSSERFVKLGLYEGCYVSLGDMLQAVNPRDHSAVKDEVIVDLVNQCRSNQKKLMQMLTNTGDEKLLARGLELNDGLQSLLAKHDAICSGSPLTIQVTTSCCCCDKKPDRRRRRRFAQLTRRRSKTGSRSSQSTSAATKDSLVPVNEPVVTTSYEPSASPPHTPNSSPPAIHQNMHHPAQVPHGPLPYDSYIVPWAQPQVQPQYQPQNHSNPLVLGQQEFQSQTQYHPYTSGYPLPKWANTPGYFTGANMCNSFPVNASNGDVWGTPMLAEKPYIPPYRLFEDLNVLGNGDGRLKMKSTTSSSTQSMVGERK